MIDHQSTLFNRNGWSFHNPVKVTLGRGCRQQLVELLSGKNILIVTTKRGRQQLCEDSILSQLQSICKIGWVDSVTENPGLTDLQFEIDTLKQNTQYQVAVAFGGGSSMDAAKAINVALADDCRDYSLAELLKNPDLHQNAKPKPLITVTTTSGTGSEVTPFATVWHHEEKKKLSLASPAVWPTAAFVDAALTDTVPLEATISTGLDAINQAAESVWNKNANSITLAYAFRALQLGFDALPKLVLNEPDPLAREQMAEASLLAGLAISHTRTALCHSMSYPITAHYGVSHGLACAFTMPAVLRHNLAAEDGRFAQLAMALNGDSNLEALVSRFDKLHETMLVKNRVIRSIPSLNDLLKLAPEMFTPGRADNNLADVNDLVAILKQSWGE